MQVRAAQPVGNAGRTQQDGSARASLNRQGHFAFVHLDGDAQRLGDVDQRAQRCVSEHGVGGRYDHAQPAALHSRKQRAHRAHVCFPRSDPADERGQAAVRVVEFRLARVKLNLDLCRFHVG